jgi:hypothetical protein
VERFNRANLDLSFTSSPSPFRGILGYNEGFHCLGEFRAALPPRKTGGGDDARFRLSSLDTETRSGCRRDKRVRSSSRSYLAITERWPGARDNHVHMKRAEPSAILQLVRNEVDAPGLIRPCGLEPFLPSPHSSRRSVWFHPPSAPTLPPCTADTPDTSNRSRLRGSAARGSSDIRTVPLPERSRGYASATQCVDRSSSGCGRCLGYTHRTLHARHSPNLRRCQSTGTEQSPAKVLSHSSLRLD